MQETLWAATRAIRTFRGAATSIASWMFTMVRRECLRLLERRRRTTTLDGVDDETLVEVVGPSDALAVRRRVELLASALAALDPLHPDYAAQRRRYGAEFFAIAEPVSVGQLDFFQHDRGGRRKGIVVVELGDEQGGPT